MISFIFLSFCCHFLCASLLGSVLQNSAAPDDPGEGETAVSRRSNGQAKGTDELRKLVHDIDNGLGAIRGYCELAKIKHENGDALDRRMDAAIDTVQELSTLIHRLRIRL